MYGFEGTECKIFGCIYPVWPNRTLGYCHRHSSRFKTGRMAENGDLLPLTKTKECESCGKIFIPKRMGHNIRWCPLCRPAEYAKIQTENNHGIYRKDPKGNASKKKYIKMVLDKIIKRCELIKKYKPILDMRLAGLTYTEIAQKAGCSKQNVHQICSKYSCQVTMLDNKKQRQV